MEELGELVGFLVNSKPEVGSSDGREQLKPTPVLPNLCRLLGDLRPIATLAYTCLINLSEDNEYAGMMLQRPRFCVSLVRNLTNEEHQLGELDVLLLNNLTRLEEGSRQLLQVGESLEGFYLEKLVEILVSKRGDERKDPYAWIARVLMNVSQLPEARKILLDEKRDIFKDLLKDIQHRNPIRKRAVLGAIKNCCFEQRKHAWLLAEDKVNILPYLLYPLLGPNKMREEDVESRKLLVEALTLLTGTRRGRDFMRAKKAYPIVRDAHRVEDNEAIGELYFILVDHLMRDEEPLPAAEPIETPSMNQETEAEKKLLADAQHEEEMPEMDVLVSDSEDEDEGEKESVD
ncbi:uncharacterized protein ACA1_195250 [Acanthamoeba castellanii str. Neff]|uniref:Protein HGH1 N-terminal domain-containing protein n=1 Tax=Acanthamoeba castellanii (strain ATCC 30010 / Neff) TaxID=1257118 RepID=L8H6S9_ACACF|nr:uncharacterized protein ACA1_195250 [Acanthamoeba castellanii str. Neff]ELR20443.1 hypothetical protein ACA1_195250 [Acanthamoeba castellanii str. Neff]